MNNNFTGNTADPFYGGGGVYIMHNSGAVPLPYFGNNNLFGNTLPDYYGATGGTHHLSVDLPVRRCVPTPTTAGPRPPASMPATAASSPRSRTSTSRAILGSSYAAVDSALDEWVDRVAPVVLGTELQVPVRSTSA